MERVRVSTNSRKLLTNKQFIITIDANIIIVFSLAYTPVMLYTKVYMELKRYENS